MRTAFRLPSTLLLVATTVVPSLGATDLYVSPSGDNANDGTETTPFATLERARDEIRAMRTSQGDNLGPVTVWIHPGVYALKQSILFTEQDSGTAESPIHYRSLGSESPVFTGGAVLAAGQKKDNRDLYDMLPKASREHVQFYTIEQLLDDATAEPHTRALGKTMSPAPMELFCGASVLPRAGWPNAEWATAKLHPSKNNTLSLDRRLDPRDLSHCWVHGFWSHDWADSFDKASYSPAGNKKTEIAIHLDSTEGTIRNGARFRLENLLTELDAPGEWYIDSSTNRVVVWPSSTEDSRLVVSALETAFSIYETQYVTFEGLTIEGTRAMGIEVVGGRNVRLDNCTVRYSGNVGINLYHGHEHSIVHCDVYGTGSSGIRIEGGDRTTLESAGHTCTDNDIHDCCYSYCAQRPAVAVYGVGIQVHSNRIYNQPDAAIALHGNEHSVESNEIHHVCQVADDAGAITLAHDPTFRGNHIVRNHIFDIGGLGHKDIVGIYLDDFASGTQVEGNVLERTVRGIVIGGGRDNLLEKNVIVDCLAGIQVDCRGQRWAKQVFQGETSIYQKYCAAISHNTDVYAERYPQLATVLDDEPQVAKGNTIRLNEIRCPIAIDLQDGLSESVVQLEQNQTEAKSMLVNMDLHEASLTKMD